jgi:SET domain-containing protein
MLKSQNKKFIIKDTEKYGMGIFASENIKSGDVIHVLNGEMISFEEAIRRIRIGEEQQTDSLQIDLELDMDLDELSRTFNHSCNPNAGLRKTSELFAIRDIKKGEEITYDYSSTIGPNIEESLWKMKCECRSKNCRNILGNVLSIPKPQLDLYKKAGALQAYIKKELNLIELAGGRLPKYNKIII